MSDVTNYLQVEQPNRHSLFNTRARIEINLDTAAFMLYNAQELVDSLVEEKASWEDKTSAAGEEERKRLTKAIVLAESLRDPLKDRLYAEYTAITNIVLFGTPFPHDPILGDPQKSPALEEQSSGLVSQNQYGVED